MKAILNYLTLVALTILLVDCNPVPKNDEQKTDSEGLPGSTVDTIDVPCSSGSTVQIVCDTALISLPCNEGSEVSCGDKIYVAAPVDTIDSPSGGLIDTIHHRSEVPTGTIYHRSEEPVDTIDSRSEEPVDTIDSPTN